MGTTLQRGSSVRWVQSSSTLPNGVEQVGQWYWLEPLHGQPDQQSLAVRYCRRNLLSSPKNCLVGDEVLFCGHHSSWSVDSNRFSGTTWMCSEILLSPSNSDIRWHCWQRCLGSEKAPWVEPFAVHYYARHLHRYHASFKPNQLCNLHWAFFSCL